MYNGGNETLLHSNLVLAAIIHTQIMYTPKLCIHTNDVYTQIQNPNHCAAASYFHRCTYIYTRICIHIQIKM